VINKTYLNLRDYNQIFKKQVEIMSVVWHLRSNRKSTGGKLHRHSKKKKYQRGSTFIETKIGERKAKITRTRGGNTKVKLLACDYANVADRKTGKIKKVKILSVKESQTTHYYVRRNIITKGEIIETELGPAKVTSRPGQDGVVNAVLIEEKK